MFGIYIYIHIHMYLHIPIYARLSLMSLLYPNKSGLRTPEARCPAPAGWRASRRRLRAHRAWTSNARPGSFRVGIMGALFTKT